MYLNFCVVKLFVAVKSILWLNVINSGILFKENISIVRNTYLLSFKKSLGTLMRSSVSQIGFFLVFFPFGQGRVFSPDHLGIVHGFGFYWTVLNMVASDDTLQFLYSKKSQGVLQLPIFDRSFGFSLDKTFLIFRDSVKEY